MNKVSEFFYNQRFYEIFASHSIDNYKVYKVMMYDGDSKKIRSIRHNEIDPIIIEKKFFKK